MAHAGHSFIFIATRRLIYNGDYQSLKNSTAMKWSLAAILESLLAAMIKNIPQDLLEKGLITVDQFTRIDAIVNGKLVSVFYELRTLLYLGIMLFTTGVGILIYENIGEAGHIASVTAIFLLDAFCVYYIFRHVQPYTNGEAKAPTPYFDYIVLLTALLFVSVLGYLQFLYDVFQQQPELITLATALSFFYLAYRFDSKAVLSLAITALASFWSISVSPQRWYRGDFESFEHLYLTAIIFAVSMNAIALILDRKRVKPHFTFTYVNFATLIFFVGAITGLFADEWYGVYLLLIYGGCIFAYYMARWKKSFLFLLYAFLSAYIGTTFLLADLAFRDMIEIWFIYSVASCGGFIYFIIRFKNYFKQQS
jgi:hypothetical protein